MSYKVLARRHRPQVFADIIGHGHLVSALKLAISKNQIGHAYLLTGTRGIGKTTIARIFAKSIRCLNVSKEIEPCNDCVCCRNFDDSIDVIEIDGASNNSVENIRDLISTAQFLPTTGNRKVYIIDEVHMLSTSAFNALLKTLEEPPEHVVFILATTDPNKLPETITSRCQRFDFINATDEELSQLVDKILVSEEMEFADPALRDIIIKFSGGSYRDCLSILEKIIQFRHQKVITAEFLYEILGVPSEKQINKLKEHILECRGQEMLKVYNNILFMGTSLDNLASSLLESFYSDIRTAMLKEAENLAELIWVFESISKDSEWALRGKNSKQQMAVSLIKISSRNQIFKSKPLIDNKPEQKINPETEKKNQLISKIRNLLYRPSGKISPTIRTNLLHSDIVGFQLNNDAVTIVLAFKNTDEIFYEFVSDDSISKKLEEALASELAMPVKISLSSLSEEESKNFESNSDKMLKEHENHNRFKESKIKNDPLIQKAESIFGKKIDKIILNSSNKE